MADIMSIIEHFVKSSRINYLKIAKQFDCSAFKGKVHPKNMLVLDVRSDKIGKNAVGRLSISPLVLKIFAFKVEELVIWRQPF